MSRSLIIRLENIADQYGIKLQETKSVTDATNELIEKLSKKCRNPVVILIDEYDSPIVEHVEEGAKARSDRSILRSFFTAVKANDHRIKLLFVTGVSRFSHVTLFSGMNLEDISMQSTYGNLVGYTEHDVHTYLNAHVSEVALKANTSVKSVFDQMRYWYNGYRFSPSAELIYNPWSVLRYLNSGTLSNYWFESGTPRLPLKYGKNLQVCLRP